METLPYEPIDLIACDAQRNFWRGYRIAACRDLFGHILIETQSVRADATSPAALTTKTTR